MFNEDVKDNILAAFWLWINDQLFIFDLLAFVKEQNKCTSMKIAADRYKNTLLLLIIKSWNTQIHFILL